MTDDPALTRVAAVLEAHGLRDRLIILDVEVPTAVAAADVLGCPVGAIANSLVFCAHDTPVLVIASGAHRVDTSLAAAALGVPSLSRATPDVVLAATGQVVGGCAPVGHPAPLPTVVDESLSQYDEVFAGGGVKHAMMRLSYAEMLALTGAPAARLAAT